MKEIIDYQLIKSQSVGDLTRSVSGEIRNGWQPFGGVSSASTTYMDDGHEKSDTVMFSQAMVRYFKE